VGERGVSPEVAAELRELAGDVVLDAAAAIESCAE
jgi:hypothetical protein